MRIRAEISFAQVPQWVLEHPTLSAMATRVYGVIALASNADGELVMYRKTLARRCGGVSEATIKRAVAELIEAEALVRIERRDQGGSAKQVANLYLLRALPPGSPMTHTAPVTSEARRVTSDTPRLKDDPGGGSQVTQEEAHTSRSSEAPTGLAHRPHVTPEGRDLLWDAVMVASSIDTAEIPPTARAGYNAAVEGLRRLGASPDDVATRASHAWFKITPFALLRHWAELATPLPGRQRTDRAAEIAQMAGGES